MISAIYSDVYMFDEKSINNDIRYIENPLIKIGWHFQICVFESIIPENYLLHSGC